MEKQSLGTAISPRPDRTRVLAALPSAPLARSTGLLGGSGSMQKQVALSPSPERNRLLAALSPAQHSRIFSRLELVAMQQGTTLREAHHASQYVYFPVDCIVSEMYLMSDGSSVQVAMIGREGLVGLSALIGGEAAVSYETVIASGFAYRLHRDIAEQEFNQEVPLQKAVLSYAQSLLTQMAQNAVCNQHHTVDQQLCRWLLLVRDRAQSDDLALTHGLIAGMLGVRREGITTSAGKLQALGAISYRRGHITILQRSVLERHCCECYRVIRAESERVLPGTRRI
jgi:CRP-like cAMP-binding protein